MNQNPLNMEELYSLEGERLMLKIAKIFEIKNKGATEKAIILCFKLSHEKILDINANIEIIVATSAGRSKEQVKEETDHFSLQEQKHLFASIINIAFFIYSFSFVDSDLNDELFTEFSNMFVKEISEITNNVIQI